MALKPQIRGHGLNRCHPFLRQLWSFDASRSSTIFALDIIMYTLQRLRLSPLVSALPLTNHISLRHRLPCEHRRHLPRHCACCSTSDHALRKRVSVTIDVTTVSQGFSSPLLYLLRLLLTDCQPLRLVLRHKFHTSPALERGRCTQCSIMGDEGICGKLEGGTGLAHRVPETRTVVMGADEGANNKQAINELKTSLGCIWF